MTHICTPKGWIHFPMFSFTPTTVGEVHTGGWRSRRARLPRSFLFQIPTVEWLWGDVATPCPRLFLNVIPHVNAGVPYCHSAILCLQPVDWFLPVANPQKCIVSNPEGAGGMAPVVTSWTPSGDDSGQSISLPVCTFTSNDKLGLLDRRSFQKRTWNQVSVQLHWRWGKYWNQTFSGRMRSNVEVLLLCRQGGGKAPLDSFLSSLYLQKMLTLAVQAFSYTAE